MTYSKLDNILDQALAAKLQLDRLICLEDKTYVCLECGTVTDYYKFGGICAGCEAKSELYG